MNAIEFKTRIENGVIAIPEAYQGELKDGEDVLAIVTVQPRSTEQTGNSLDYLLDHPLELESFTPLKREDIYER